jgi:hypothetical protein
MIRARRVGVRRPDPFLREPFGTLPNGRSIETGDLFRVEGLRGLFRFRAFVTTRTGVRHVDAYGPVTGRGAARARARAFRPEAVTSIDTANR